jgi:transcriptional regulator with XRE-family HTH domain
VPVSRVSQAFGVAVRSARLRKGFSQEQLAERAGLHPTYVGMIERGVRNATLDVAAKLADALIHRKMAELLERHPAGLTSGQLREKLGLGPTEQAQLDRRRRELRRWYRIEKKRVGTETIYIFAGRLAKPLESTGIGLRKRAAILAAAHGRCQMCGKTVERHGITLVVDHKIPRDWGGTNDDDNLWAICEECNAGKKAHFASLDQNLMRRVMHHKSVHVRIGGLLKASRGKPVSSELIAIVANQEDWQKRTRELRYLDWRIDVSRSTLPSGRVRSSYTLKRSTPWPPDPSGWIRRYELDRKTRNRA